MFITVEALRKTDTDYLNEEKGHKKNAGSTATTALLVGDRLLVPNVGDSRVVACRAGKGLLFTWQEKISWKEAMVCIGVHVGEQKPDWLPK